MTRVQDWPVRMLDAIRDHQRQPFAWGTSDCMQMVCDAAGAMTGARPYAATRGAYDSKHGAARCLAEHGFASIVEALAAVYEEVPPALAQRGDIGILQTEGLTAALVCEGRYFIGKSPDGALAVPRHKILKAFRVA